MAEHGPCHCGGREGISKKEAALAMGLFLEGWHPMPARYQTSHKADGKVMGPVSVPKERGVKRNK